jgi:hypothetical protein
MKATLKPRWSKAAGKFDLERENLPDGAKELASWLSDDVHTERTASEWIEQLQLMKKTGESGYISTGNSHHVRAIDEHIFLECEHIENLKTLLHIEHLIRALADYRKFLKLARNHESDPPMSFDIEYSKEGNDALDHYMRAGGKLGLSAKDIEEHTKEFRRR